MSETTTKGSAAGATGRVAGSKHRLTCSPGEPFVQAGDLLAKRKRWAPREPPQLPGARGRSQFPVYDAVWRLGMVLVPDGNQAADLFARGSYGKGLLSRSQPDFDARRHRAAARCARETGFIEEILQSRGHKGSRATDTTGLGTRNDSTLPCRGWWGPGPEEVGDGWPAPAPGGRAPSKGRSPTTTASAPPPPPIVVPLRWAGINDGEIDGRRPGQFPPAPPAPALAVPTQPDVRLASKGAIFSIVKTASKRKHRRPTSYAEYAQKSTGELRRCLAALRARAREHSQSPLAPLGGEPLFLHPVEAFFLHRDMQCLSVRGAAPGGQDDRVLSTADLWERFVRDDARFPANYAVYYFFRARNWCPKSGLKFGTDWILYHGGPEYSHAAFQVLTSPEIGPPPAAGERQDDRLRLLDRLGANSTVWPTIHHLSRLAEGVCKLLCVCRVFIPARFALPRASSSSSPAAGAAAAASVADPSSVSPLASLVDALVAAGPECIDSFEVQPIVTRRWVNRELDQSEAGRNW